MLLTLPTITQNQILKCMSPFYFIPQKMIKYHLHSLAGASESQKVEDICAHSQGWQVIEGECLMLQTLMLHTLVQVQWFLTSLVLICIFSLFQWGPTALWKCPLHLQHCPESYWEGQLHSHSRGHQWRGGTHVSDLGQGCGKNRGLGKEPGQIRAS